MTPFWNILNGKVYLTLIISILQFSLCVCLNLAWTWAWATAINTKSVRHLLFQIQLTILMHLPPLTFSLSLAA